MSAKEALLVSYLSLVFARIPDLTYSQSIIADTEQQYDDITVLCNYIKYYVEQVLHFMNSTRHGLKNQLPNTQECELAISQNHGRMVLPFAHY